MTRVSVIVSNFNGARFLPKLMASLRAQRGVETEIIVVDRQSSDESATILEAESGLKLISEPPETGLVAGYHAGTAVATAELLFFCNEDMWFDPDCLSRLAAHIDLPNRIGAADPWQWTYDGAEWIHGGTCFVPAQWAIASPYPTRRLKFDVPLPDGAEIPFPCAGAVLMHRDVYREVGGWDGSFFLDWEDVDFFLRAWQRGWKSVQVPAARVYHAVSASNALRLTSLNLNVSQRRYLAQRANLAVIALKYFSAVRLPLAGWVWLAMTANNLFRGRWKYFGRDLRVLGEIAARLPAAWRFRQANASYNHYFPGESFFTRPEFNGPHSVGSTPPPAGAAPVPAAV